MLLLARQKRLLGVVVGERSMLIAEAPSNHRAGAPPLLAEFAFPDQLNLDQPEALGARFAEFLAQNNFSATDTVIGIPAKQLVAQRVEVPPTDPRTAAQLLWLETTTHFSEDLGPMVFDFAGEISSDRATTVNLIGLQQAYLSRLLAFAEAAGLEPIAVTATIAALFAATAPHIDDMICLSVRGDSAELAEGDGSGAPQLKHVGSAAAIPRLIMELRRHSASNSSVTNGSGQRKLVLWDDFGLDGQTTSAIAEAARMTVIPGRMSWLDGPSSGASTGGAPLALLLPARNGRRPPLDFLHPQVTPPARRMPLSRTVAIAATVAVALIVTIGAYADVLHIQHQIAATRSELDSLGPQLAIARPFATQMQFAKTFQPGQLNYLKCLKDLTVSIPQPSQTYLTSFALENDMKGACIGHSGSEQDALDLLDKLNATGRFTALSRKLDARPKGKAAADVLFTINFTYAPDKVSTGG